MSHYFCKKKKTKKKKKKKKKKVLKGLIMLEGSESRETYQKEAACIVLYCIARIS
jgi:hypothetical protein